MYKKVRDAQHRSHLSNELMMYHMKVFNSSFPSPEYLDCHLWFPQLQVSNEETLKLMQEEASCVHKIDSKFCEFGFIPRSMNEMDTPAAVIAVFQDVGLKGKWSISHETLGR